MIYIDTSCLLKVLRPEPLSEAVWLAIDGEESVQISSLAELEMQVQLKGAWTGGRLSRRHARQAEARFELMRTLAPFDFRKLPMALFQTALRQHRASARIHCRSLDRLHLAAMEELGISRLMTHDDAQVRAAIKAGFKVVCPGRAQPG
ncbi:MAG: PIN domain-containing protein [Pedosphaera sp.]|nr:PIN domain-containing protein [Pedosphaera sp.]